MTASPTAPEHPEKADQEDDNDREESDIVSEDEEEEEDDDDSLWSELASGWKQHLLAVVVAFVAATMGYLHMRSRAVVKDELIRKLPEHMVDYHRMEGITFCDTAAAEFMIDFTVPKKLFTALERLYDGGDMEELECAKQQITSGEKTFMTGYMAYTASPSIQQITSHTYTEAASLSYTGFAAKFVNLSPLPKLLYWQDARTEIETLVAEIAPFESVATATTPGNAFSMTPVYDSSHHLQRWTVTQDMAIVVYQSLVEEELSKEHRDKLELQQLSLSFARDYLVATGRTYLSNFPRPPPKHALRVPQSIGDTLTRGDITMTALSVTPAVYEIDNFLSADDCQHLIQLAKAQGMHPSTVVGASSGKVKNKKTRSSETTWLARHKSEVTDKIYREAAKILNMDSALLQHASSRHFPSAAEEHSLAEELQIVHYGSDDEYTPHHDWTLAEISHRHQPVRFATLLVYLQEPDGGGATTFPLAVTGHRHDGLVVEPVVGKAIMFYNILGDGNVDDLALHASQKVEEGNKWIANLWIWDPIID